MTKFAKAAIGASLSGRPRNADDFYPTPPSATLALIEAEGARWRDIGGPIWEAAAGRGDMVRPIRDAGFDVVASDAVDYGLPGCQTRSFVSFEAPLTRVLITNPPFSACNSRQGCWWIRHANALGLDYMALLLPLDWDGAADRLDLFDLWRPARRLGLTWRLDFQGGGNSTAKCAWWIWERGWKAPHTQSSLLRRPADDADATFIPPTRPAPVAEAAS